MDKQLFSGVCTALVTPFLNGEVNYPLVERLLKHQMDAGIRQVVLAGTTGESPTLSDKEKITLFQRAKQYTGNDCMIIAGTGSNSTEHTIHLSLAAQESGADALLVVAPYYNKGNADGLYKHYSLLANSVHIPIIIYNVPSRTGVDISVELYSKLSHIPNIAGVKEASSDITKITRILAACPKSFSVWSGNDDQTVPVISLGGKGVISVLSNVMPYETIRMTEAALAGDFDTASALQRDLLPQIDALFAEVNPIPVKHAMHCIGFDCGPCRLPLGNLNKVNQAKIEELFR